VWKVPGGGSRFINVIAIEQQHAGHAKMAGLVAAGCGSSTYLGRIIIIVDDDIDITNPAEVMWAVATRWDPKTATDIIDGVWTGYIDPMLCRNAVPGMTSPTAASSFMRCAPLPGRMSFRRSTLSIRPIQPRSPQMGRKVEVFGRALMRQYRIAAIRATA
jgi:hypothetical protein